MPLQPGVRALFFDVFGTVVDWRTTVTNELLTAAKTALNSDTSTIPLHMQMKATSMSAADWGRFAQEWRNSYKRYTSSRANDPSLPVVTVDEHHHESLRILLQEWALEGLWNAEQVQAMSLVWHKLVPWPDSQPGLTALSSQFWTCTLSNGNFSLLEDLKKFGKLDFTHIFSAEEFRTFKPNKAVYLGAAQKLGIPPSHCTLVAAHLNDLEAARGCGFSTIYVERPEEDDWSKEKIEQAKREGWVDIWVGEKEGGFIAVDRKIREQSQT